MFIFVSVFMDNIPITLSPKDYSYDIMIVEGFIDKPNLFIKDAYKTDQYIIICDNQINNIFGEQLLNNLRKGVKKIEICSFKSGEKSKNIDTVLKIIKKMLRLKFDRKTCVLALGGGVTGDLAGFVSNIFMRGIPFIQIPTSLLAMVDSSIGGKTGIDFIEGKNLIGTFYQPKRVIIDPVFLETLPETEYINGLAEVIKYGIIWDKEFFMYLNKNHKKILARDKKTIKYVLHKSALIKAEIVMKDEKESRLRRILNFGHTYGHAIEALSDYSLRHGEAIAIGMHFACKIAERRGFTGTKEILKLLRKFSLPVCPNKRYSFKSMINKMRSDKKNVRGKFRFVLPRSIGKVYIEEVEEEEILLSMGYLKESCVVI